MKSKLFIIQVSLQNILEQPTKQQHFIFFQLSQRYYLLKLSLAKFKINEEMRNNFNFNTKLSLHLFLIYLLLLGNLTLKGFQKSLCYNAGIVCFKYQTICCDKKQNLFKNIVNIILLFFKENQSKTTLILHTSLVCLAAKVENAFLK